MHLLRLLQAPAKSIPVILQRHRQVTALPKRKLRFEVSREWGGMVGTAEVVQFCCDLWNWRVKIVAALRLAYALEKNPMHAVRLQTGGCTCGTKTPEPEYHAEDCVYAAVAGLETMEVRKTQSLL